MTQYNVMVLQYIIELYIGILHHTLFGGSLKGILVYLGTKGVGAPLPGGRTNSTHAESAIVIDLNRKK